MKRRSYNFESHTFAKSALLVLVLPLHSQLPRQLKVACKTLNTAIKKTIFFKKLLRLNRIKKKIKQRTLVKFWV